VELSNIPGRRTREDVGRGGGAEKCLEGAKTSGRCLKDTIRIHSTYREVEDQRVRRFVSRGDFVNLDVVPCARSNRELNL
jgi:hypothetical protein